MAVKASDRVKFYKNKNGATIGSCDRKVFEVSGVLDEGELVNAKTIFGIQNLPSTSVAIKE